MPRAAALAARSEAFAAHAPPWTPPRVIRTAPPPREFLAGDNICRSAVCRVRPRCCEVWTADCHQALVAAAYMRSDSSAQTGACYVHDRSSCPGCACPFYVKAQGAGYDGGTGCLEDARQVLDVLYHVCGEGRCEPD